MKLGKIIAKLEKNYPPKRALEGDFIGLQMGSEDKVVNKALIALDVNVDTIDQAIKNDVDVIIAHHPFYRGPLDEALNDKHFKKMHDKLSRNKISVFIMHTNYDCAPRGMNDVLVRMYEPTKIEYLNPLNHLGKVGKFKNAKTLDDMVGKTAHLFALDAVQIVEGKEKEILNYAICGGSGSKYQIDDALNANCQLLITGELNYHNQMYAKEMGLNVILATHFMEVVFIEDIKKFLSLNTKIEAIAASQQDPITIWK